jgi:2-keto-4-pentenoate hydratase/2-oxohepta-3-ene-1,7-dioic acid hydratase in catechol pathway
MVFARFPNVLIGSGAQLPDGPSEKVDYEGEIAVDLGLDLQAAVAHRVGDIIATGTPEGVGAGANLRPEHVGRLGWAVTEDAAPNDQEDDDGSADRRHRP